MSSLSLNLSPSRTHLVARTVSERDDVLEERAKKARIDIPVNHILRRLPAEVMTDVVLPMAQSIAATRVSKAFQTLNLSVTDKLWKDVEDQLRPAPESLAPYLVDVPGSAKERVKNLYDQLTEELRILDPDALSQLRPKNRLFDPTLYLEMAEKIKEINDLSLMRAWTKIRATLIAIVAINNLNNFPAVNATAQEIRAWLNDVNNHPLFLGVTRLNLSGLNLLVIPPEMNHFRRLKRLNLAENLIKGIKPSSFAQLTDLVDVRFTNNEIASLPPNLFSTCTQLESVCFKRNKLKHLPPNLFANCPRLVVANFSSNRIVALPETLFRNKHDLEQVYFNENEVSKLPSSFFQGCDSLKFVEFIDNFIDEIPVDFFQDCEDLLEVCFSANNLLEINEKLFERNIFLKSVDFGHNFISEIPEELFKHNPSLTGAYFNDNNLSTFVNDPFKYCPKLQRLDFQGNQIDYISNEFCKNCNFLLTAYMKGNPVTQELYDGTVGHVNLKWAYSQADMLDYD